MAPSPDPAELRAWIRLNLEPGLKSEHLQLLLSIFGMPQNICTASSGSLARYLAPDLASRLGHRPDDTHQAAIEQSLEWLRGPGHALLTLADRDSYPAALMDLASDAPPVLFAHGNLDLLQRPAIAIVGARSATQNGMDNAQDFAQYLAGQGWCIVSGLASGIDTAAHQGALLAGPTGGGTIAVLGTGIDRVYPTSNRDLAHRIAAEGLLLSEFPLGTKGLPMNFPRRNRLVAALSRGVLVVEAAKRSGSLITARLAGNLGREVFAIPGSIHSPLSHGCHALIRQGAKLVESGQDIWEELQQGKLPGIDRPTPAPPTPPPTAMAPPDGLPADAFEKLLKALGRNPTGLDQIQSQTGWTTSELLSRLTLMELAGQIVCQADGRYLRRR
jgi:DNA processing protein